MPFNRNTDTDRYYPEESGQNTTIEPQSLWRRYRVIAYIAIALLLVGGVCLLLMKMRGKQDTADIALPREFGGTIHSPSLVKLLNAAHQHDLNPGQLRLSLEGASTNSPPTVPMGAHFKVRISSPRDCYYALIHRDSSGTFQLLIPNPAGESEGDGKLRAGFVKELSLHTTPPGGQQEFILFGAEKPIQIETVLSGPPETYKQSLSVVPFPYLTLEK